MNGHFASQRVLSTAFGSGTGWVVGFEVETRYWVVRLHAVSSVVLPFWGGCLGGVCGWSSLPLSALCVGGGGVGLFLENCIVDASIL